MIFEKKPLSIFINISIALTLVVAMSIKYLVATDTKNHVLSFFKTIHQPRNLEPAIADLAALAIGLSDADLRVLADRTRAAYGPSENQSIFLSLLKYKNNKNANLLGVYLMENTGYFYKNKYFVYYVGTYYASGIYVNKDLAKAKFLFSEELQKDNDSAKFQLGLLYLNKAFSEYNPATARKLIQSAADNGLVQAQKKLAELPAQ